MFALEFSEIYVSYAEKDKNCHANRNLSFFANIFFRNFIHFKMCFQIMGSYAPESPIGFPNYDIVFQWSFTATLK